MHDSRDPKARLGSPELHPTQRIGDPKGATRPRTVAQQSFGTIVGGKDDQGVFINLHGLERLHQFADRGVQVSNVGEVLGLVVVLGHTIVLLDHLLGRGHRFVGFVKCHIHKERLFSILRPLFFQPGQGLIHHELTTVSLKRSDRLTVADEIPWILMGRTGVVLGPEPMIKPSRVGLRLLRGIELSVAMPFARHAGSVPRFFKELRNGHLGSPQVYESSAGYPVVDSCSIRTTPGQQANPRGRADGSSGIKVRETNAILGHLVKIRRLYFRMSVAGEITVAQVIAKHDHDVGPFLLLCMNLHTGANENEDSKETKPHGIMHLCMEEKKRRKVAMKICRYPILFSKLCFKY